MKKLLLLVSLTCIGLYSIAGPSLHSSFLPKNKKKSGFDKTRLLIGPGIGFGAAQRAFSFNLSPSVAYCFTDNFHAGTTLSFSYFQQAFDYNNLNTNALETFKLRVPTYKWSVFGRYHVANLFVLNVEPEIMSTKFLNANSLQYNASSGKLIDNSSRIMVPALLIGAGYAQRFGGLGYGGIMAGYDVVQNPNSPYFQTFDIKFVWMLQLFN